MPVINGRYVGSDAEDILDAMFTVADGRRDNKLNDDQVAAIKEFYRPFALVVEQLQLDMRDVLDSTRLAHAEEKSLSEITAQYGITRNPAKKAVGTQKFYFDSAKSTDTSIPAGTTVQTEGTDPILFETDESATIASGNTSTTVGITAVEPGVEGNVGADSITAFGSYEPDPELKTTNPSGTTEGRDKESDDHLRKRARKSVSEGSRATAPAIIRKLESLEQTEAVTLYVNDTETDNYYGNGLPSGTLEPIVQYDGPSQDVIDALSEVKAGAEPIVSGYNGTSVTGDVKWPNGQTWPMEYSAPSEVTIYVDVTLSKDPDTYPGDREVRDSIVQYIGGELTDGTTWKDGLDAGENVLFGEIEYRVRDVPGVYDVTDITVGTSDSPTGTSNVSISNTEIATSDARSGSSAINITSNDV